jgi:transposase
MVLNGILYVLTSGCRWCKYGSYKTAWRRLKKWEERITLGRGYQHTDGLETTIPYINRKQTYNLETCIHQTTIQTRQSKEDVQQHNPD